MKYIINVSKLNERGFDHLKEVFENFEGIDYDYLYAYLSYLEDAEIVFTDYSYISEFSSTIIRVMNDVNEDFNNLTLSYGEENEPMKRVILDVTVLNEEGHDYLMKLFDFPDSYGKTLDALYDCLGDLDDTEVIIINMDEVNENSLKILSIFDEVAEEYGNLRLTYES